MPRSPLTREDFVGVALDIIHESSVDKLSMRKVAARLNVSAMAMYKHFPNKEALLSAALDSFIANANVLPKRKLRWDKWVEQVARGMYSALCQDMSWVPFLGAIRLGEQATQVTDTFVKTLTDAGFSSEQALRAYFTMLQLVVGAVCLRSSLSPQTADDEKITATTQAYLSSQEASRLALAPAYDEVVRQEPLDISLPFFMSALQENFSSR